MKEVESTCQSCGFPTQAGHSKTCKLNIRTVETKSSADIQAQFKELMSINGPMQVADRAFKSLVYHQIGSTRSPNTREVLHVAQENFSRFINVGKGFVEAQKQIGLLEASPASPEKTQALLKMLNLIQRDMDLLNGSFADFQRRILQPFVRTLPGNTSLFYEAADTIMKKLDIAKRQFFTIGTAWAAAQRDTENEDTLEDMRKMK